MAKFEWNVPNKINLWMLKVVGIWPETETHKFDLYFCYYHIASFAFIYPHVICQVIKLYFINDIIVAGAMFFILLTEMIAVVKMQCIVRNLKMLKKLVAATNDVKLHPQNEAQKLAVKSGIDFWTKAFYFFFISGLLTCTIWALFPILDGGYKDYKLPFFAWYPYDYRQSPHYEFTYVHQMISICLIAFINMGTDAFTAGLLTFCAGQCDILSDRLRNFHLCSNLREGFISYLKQHLRILKFAEDTSTFVDIVLLFEFVSSSVSIGLTLFLMNVVGPSTSEFYSHTAYLTAIILEIFMYCWFGNEVMLKSGAFAYAAYECDWTEFSESLKKDMLFFILRTQSPFKFSAKGLFYISLETFVLILRTGWSYFALLSTLSSS